MTRRVIGLLGLGALAIGSLVAGCGDNIIDRSGRAYTILGLPGETGFNGDGLTARETRLYWTMDTEFTRDGTLYFLDWNNHLVRRLDADGRVRTVVGWTDPIFPGDGNAADPGAEYTAEGSPGADVQLNHPTGLHEMADGRILLMAWHDHKLREILPATDHVRIVAGAGPGFAGDGGPAAQALFKQPSRFAFDADENCFVVDQQNQRIRVIDAATGIITTVAGSGQQGFAGDGGPALAASLNFEIGDNPEPSGGIAVADDAIYVADTDNNRIRKIDRASGTITTIAGTGEAAFTGDGVATAVALSHPRDLELGPDGNLYIADTDNARIRMLDLVTGELVTVAGTGTAGLDPSDGRLATDTQLDRPFGIDFDLDGNLIIADTLNSRLLRVER